MTDRALEDAFYAQDRQARHDALEGELEKLYEDYGERTGYANLFGEASEEGRKFTAAVEELKRRYTHSCKLCGLGWPLIEDGDICWACDGLNKSSLEFSP